ncbi:LPS-assembly lipoprotein LptE [Chitiniphilus shinanonensis]|uniref:LPS-assembly lipoprotein LptE n=1 Tax=Chitiniphilus shinanonensis TaxID=553088 RepID=A0ABQ6BRG7_9NEIS|nr:LPS assembly lipoprotein LptE [Chitiniphilus shinanonensis]GLS03815.1 LPS-assembly lipoprotein LptE [Chitiniphilus shinanonensis]
MSLRFFTTLALCLLLAACGFHLRGMGPGVGLFPYPSVFVAGDGPVAAQLRNELQQISTVHLLPAASSDAALIAVDSESSERKILSLNGNGKVSEYRIYYTVSYRVNKPGNAALIPSSSMRLFRDYTYDENNELGKEAEAQMLINDLRQDAARQILRRVSAQAKKNTAVTEDAPAKAPASMGPRLDAY